MKLWLVSAHRVKRMRWRGGMGRRGRGERGLHILKSSRFISFPLGWHWDETLRPSSVLKRREGRDEERGRGRDWDMNPISESTIITRNVTVRRRGGKRGHPSSFSSISFFIHDIPPINLFYPFLDSSSSSTITVPSGEEKREIPFILRDRHVYSVPIPVESDYLRRNQWRKTMNGEIYHVKTDSIKTEEPFKFTFYIQVTQNYAAGEIVMIQITSRWTLIPNRWIGKGVWLTNEESPVDH